MIDVLPIAEKIEIAMETLKRLPPGHFPTYKISQWPDYMRDFWELWRLYNTESANDKPNRITPTAKQIGIMNEVILWPLEYRGVISDDTWRILFARGLDHSWRKIGSVVGLSHETCRERYRVGIVELAFKINQKYNLTDLTEKPMLVDKIAEESQL